MFFYYPLPDVGGGGALTIKVRPNPAENYEANVGNASSVNVKAYISGGTAPYTVQWTFVSGSTLIYPSAYTGIDNTMNADAPHDGLPKQYTGVWRATVTDAVSATASDDFSITLAMGIQPP